MGPSVAAEIRGAEEVTHKELPHKRETEMVSDLRRHRKGHFTEKNFQMLCWESKMVPLLEKISVVVSPTVKRRFTIRASN